LKCRNNSLLPHTPTDDGFDGDRLTSVDLHSLVHGSEPTLTDLLRDEEEMSAQASLRTITPG
jgi:hypothetical protein